MRDCLDLGFYVSFTCNITYKKSQGLRDLIKIVPLDRFCLETDGPYLSPEGCRGKRNEPGFVRLLAEEIARIKGIAVEGVAEATTANAKDFFNLPI
jgi:TatD DNase family protein